MGKAACEPVYAVGDDVLARVLLHVVKAARPVDLSFHHLACFRQPAPFCKRYFMPDDAGFIHLHIKHGRRLPRVVQRARVIGLAAALRVKQGALQRKPSRALPGFYFYRLCVKSGLKGILKIQFLGHFCTPSFDFLKYTILCEVVNLQNRVNWVWELVDLS